MNERGLVEILLLDIGENGFDFATPVSNVIAITVFLGAIFVFRGSFL